jgi:hypothetical protein
MKWENERIDFDTAKEYKRYFIEGNLNKILESYNKLQTQKSAFLLVKKTSEHLKKKTLEKDKKKFSFHDKSSYKNLSFHKQDSDKFNLDNLNEPFDQDNHDPDDPDREGRSASNSISQ